MCLFHSLTVSLFPVGLAAAVDARPMSTAGCPPCSRGTRLISSGFAIQLTLLCSGSRLRCDAPGYADSAALHAVRASPLNLSHSSDVCTRSQRPRTISLRFPPQGAFYSHSRYAPHDVTRACSSALLRLHGAARTSDCAWSRRHLWRHLSTNCGAARKRSRYLTGELSRNTPLFFSFLTAVRIAETMAPCPSAHESGKVYWGVRGPVCWPRVRAQIV